MRRAAPCDSLGGFARFAAPGRRALLLAVACETALRALLRRCARAMMRGR